MEILYFPEMLLRVHKILDSISTKKANCSLFLDTRTLKLLHIYQIITCLVIILVIYSSIVNDFYNMVHL